MLWFHCNPVECFLSVLWWFLLFQSLWRRVRVVQCRLSFWIPCTPLSESCLVLPSPCGLACLGTGGRSASMVFAETCLLLWWRVPFDLSSLSFAFFCFVGCFLFAPSSLAAMHSVSQCIHRRGDVVLLWSTRMELFLIRICRLLCGFLF